MTPWELQIDELATCNCAYGCPCQFNALPTYGNCEAVVGLQINRGHFGDTDLDGLRAVAVMWWPGPIHEGGGKAFIIIDERADEPSGPACSPFSVAARPRPVPRSGMCSPRPLTRSSTRLSKPLIWRSMWRRRVGHVRVDGLVESQGRTDPQPGDRGGASRPDQSARRLRVHRGRNGRFPLQVHWPDRMSGEDRYAQFAHLHLNNHGQ